MHSQSQYIVLQGAYNGSCTTAALDEEMQELRNHRLLWSEENSESYYEVA